MSLPNDYNTENDNALQWEIKSLTFVMGIQILSEENRNNEHKEN